MRLRPFPIFLLAAASAVLTGFHAPATVAAEAPRQFVQAAPADGGPRAPRRLRIPESAARAQNLPGVDLTPGLLYEILAAEILAQRGGAAVALAKYLELAQRTRDPRIAQRAVEIALFERNSEKALEAAQIWAETDPQSLEARQALVNLYIGAGRAEEALPHMERLLAAESTNVAEGFIQINRLLSARSTDRKSTLSIIQRLAARYPKVAEAHAAVAQAAFNAGEEELALREARAAALIRPEWDFPVLMASQILARRDAASASAELKGFLERNPGSSEVRMAYARSLVAERKYGEARGEFQRIERDFPDNADVLYALGLLALDAKDYASAESSLKSLLARQPRDPNLVYLYLGQVADEQKKFAEAREWYAKVASGDQYLPAQSRFARTLAREGRIEDARTHLQGLVATSNQQRVQIIMSEAQLLREANRNREAFEVLEKGALRLPNHPDLLYDLAMAAEKVERLDVLENNLKKVIELKPDHAHAYNALGYTLADRNVRLTEARDLIEKALKIAPDDAMIIDSMGWVMYRLGDLPRALELLKRAYALMPDAEIGAHLGEVLWQMGQRAEADRVWAEAAGKAPDNETLRNTIRRFKP